MVLLFMETMSSETLEAEDGIEGRAGITGIQQYIYGPPPLTTCRINNTKEANI